MLNIETICIVYYLRKRILPVSRDLFASLSVAHQLSVSNGNVLFSALNIQTAVMRLSCHSYRRWSLAIYNCHFLKFIIPIWNSKGSLKKVVEFYSTMVTDTELTERTSTRPPGGALIEVVGKDWCLLRPRTKLQQNTITRPIRVNSRWIRRRNRSDRWPDPLAYSHEVSFKPAQARFPKKLQRKCLVMKLPGRPYGRVRYKTALTMPHFNSVSEVE